MISTATDAGAGRSLTNVKKRRGVARASLTQLTNRLKDLEGKVGSDKAMDLAQRMSQKLSDLDADFQTHHHAVVDLTDDEGTLAKEQEVLDAHDDLVTELSLRIKHVISASLLSDEASRRIATRTLSHLQKSLGSFTSVIGDDSTPPSDACLLK
jgi:hypothetical protein